MTSYEQFYAFFTNFLAQRDADLSKKSSITLDTFYQSMVAQLNAMKAQGGQFEDLADPSGLASDIALVTAQLGWPEIGAMADDAAGLGYWDDWPILTTIP